MDSFIISTQVSEPNDIESINFKDIMEATTKGLLQLSNVLTNFLKSIDFEEIGKTISSLVDKIEEVYGDGIKGYEQWGLYGWTFSPSVKYDLFKNSPASIEEANSIMEKYLSNEEINVIKSSLQNAGANVSELEEAYNCYKQGMYKSCALILFGIMDNKMYQYKLLDDRKFNRIGISFAEEYAKNKEYDDFTFQGALVNVLKAIETIFSHGKNFEKEMTIINRNYLSHGMLERNISSLECFQVWCLAYSIWIILDVVDECNNDIKTEE